MGRLFDADSEQVDIGNPASADAQADFSVMAWVYLDSRITDGAIQAKLSNSPKSGWILFFDLSNPIGNNRVEFFLRDGSPLERVASVGEEAAGEWHHWCGVLDDAADEMRLYKDGVLNNTTSSVTIAPATNTDNIIYGSESAGDSGARPFKGRLANCAFNNVVLTVGEIKQAMYRGATHRGLVYHHGLFGNASPEPDFSGNGNAGTVTGATIANPPPIGVPWGFDQAIIQVAGAAPAGTWPHGPFGHPLHGALGGPI